MAMTRSMPASAGSQVSAQFSTTSPKRTRFHPFRSKSGSEAQPGFGFILANDGSAEGMELSIQLNGSE